MAIRGHVGDTFGPSYVPAAPREYSSKAKNAQEAHEAIRPTEVSRTPDSVARRLSPEQARLYELIWKRAVASQMQSAELDQVAVDIAGARARLRANGSIVAFDGFLKLYREDVDDAPEASAPDESRMLPPMKERDPLALGKVQADQHFTQPPPRYSEASLVKRMEELGIGRPSTYASILSVLRDRSYVRMENKRFVPEDRGRLVTAFLTSFFERYVDTGFTAGLEEQLDDISGGRVDWRAVMQAFWDQFSRAVEQTRDLKISDVIDALDQDLGEHFFPARTDGGDPRLCPVCHQGRLGLRLSGKYGSFIGCSNYPDCKYTRGLAIDAGEDAGEVLKDGKRDLGHHPKTGEAVTLRRGPYGLYVQQGEADPDNKKVKPPPHVPAEGLGGGRAHLGAGAGPSVLAAHRRRASRAQGGDRGRAGPLRAVRADGRHLCVARPGRRCSGGRAEPRRGRASQEAGQRALVGAASPGRRAGDGPQGAVRALRPARPARRQPAAGSGHGGRDAGADGRAAG